MALFCSERNRLVCHPTPDGRGRGGGGWLGLETFKMSRLLPIIKIGIVRLHAVTAPPSLLDLPTPPLSSWNPQGHMGNIGDLVREAERTLAAALHSIHLPNVVQVRVRPRASGTRTLPSPLPSRKYPLCPLAEVPPVQRESHTGHVVHGCHMSPSAHLLWVWACASPLADAQACVSCVRI